MMYEWDDDIVDFLEEQNREDELIDLRYEQNWEIEMLCELASKGE